MRRFLCYRATFMHKTIVNPQANNTNTIAQVSTDPTLYNHVKNFYVFARTRFI